MDDAGAGGVIAGISLGVLFGLFLLFGVPVLYRVSGGEIWPYVLFSWTHDQERLVFLYLKKEKRDELQVDIKAYQGAMKDAIAARKTPKFPHYHKSYYYLIPDHLKFKKEYLAGKKKYPGMDDNVTNKSGVMSSTSLLASQSKADTEADEDAPMSPGPATAPAVETEDPVIDTDLDKEFVEPKEDRERRLEWIRFYVRENDLQKAFDLGWDGKPFRVAVAADPPTETVSSPGSASSAAASCGGLDPSYPQRAPMHRI
jgi:hypothetical protein